MVAVFPAYCNIHCGILALPKPNQALAISNTEQEILSPTAAIFSQHS